ncbi:MAG: lysophospholipid acyltransferase family protein [Deltaproteobacteria bacterium]|nr:lysophospholipid acyltransferase family protein [Deltaproteobacteria bacterium]MBW2448184.1 lysophospholipid acyltransferase family protein [Deltaproteobacteria bacterium]
MGRIIAEIFLRITGWDAEGERPTSKKFVLIASPHTSNWDLAYLLACTMRYKIRPRWMGKHTLFHGPMGWVMRAVGGIPIRRHLRENVVEQMTRQFEERDELCLTVPPEGTRGLTPFWKSGFYHIARSAQVPIVLGYLDYARKRGGFGPEFEPTGDIKADMDHIRAFYAGKVGKHPENFGEIRLREELEEDDATDGIEGSIPESRA